MPTTTPSGLCWPVQCHIHHTSCSHDPCRQHRAQGDPHHLIVVCGISLDPSPPIVKVTVALIDLFPELSYTCVPRLSPYSFLRAKVKNTSPYTLLSGPANIFLDNNFIAKVTAVVSTCPLHHSGGPIIT